MQLASRNFTVIREYISDPFDDHLFKTGTLQILTVHNTPEYDGVSERLNHTLLEKV